MFHEVEAAVKVFGDVRRFPIWSAGILAVFVPLAVIRYRRLER